MDKLLMIDGDNLLFQMFYGMPTRIINKDGRAIQETLGFTGGLQKIIKMTEPSHIIIIFDGEQGSNRNETYKEYKINRTNFKNVPEKDNPFTQLLDIYKVLNYMGITYIQTNGVEADDVIASYAITLGCYMQVVIASSDTDFLQLVNDNVEVLCYRGKKSVYYNVNKVIEKYSIAPEYLADFKALVGDNSDNIKGLPKIGAKTAASLIHEFGGIHAIIEFKERIQRVSIREAVNNHIDRIRLNYQLIKLTDRLQLPIDINLLKYDYKTEISTSEILKRCGIK